jgi:hypothetical protein
MKLKKSAIYLIVIFVIGAGSLGAFYRLAGETYGRVEGNITDALSGDAVWGVRVSIGERSTIKFTTTSYSLTEIPPGPYTLKARAPNYYDFIRSIRVKKGENVVDITMKGREIPDLKGILVFTEPTERGLEIEIRLTDSTRLAITNPPALPFTLEGALFVRKGTEEHYEKGRKIFEGPIDLFWDPTDRLAKNKGIIPWDRIKSDPGTERSGILEVVLHTPQGDFEYVTKDVELSRQGIH